MATGNVKATARKPNMQPSQLTKWGKNYPKIKELATKSPKKSPIHPGKKVENHDLEALVFDWVVKERRAKLAVFTTDFIDKAVSIYSESKNRDEKQRLHWVYKFMARYKLSVRTRTRVSQISADAMQPVK